jgi:hypothetical protein
VARVKQLQAAEGEAWPFVWLQEKGIKHGAR